MYAEDELRPLSALQHLLYCPRQCALIHVEQQWTENQATAEGRLAHERCHTPGAEWRGETRVVRDLAVRSLRLGLIGKTDVVEFHAGVPRPVEHKRGRPKKNSADEVQLCAQALCLEEMLDVAIPEGCIFYGKTRRRLQVTFTPELRQLTEQTAAELHSLLKSGITPPAHYEKEKCAGCSLREICQPQLKTRALAYIARSIA